MNNKGFSLMELAISVGLIAVMAGVVAAGSGMMAKCRIQREVQAVDNLRVAAQNYLTTQNLSYANISIPVLKTAGLLPTNFDPVGTNSYGGDYSVSANAADNTILDIALANVPETAGNELSGAFLARAQAINYNEGAKTWVASF